MSPELKSASMDDKVYTALKRLHNYKKLRELGAPPILVERSFLQLEKSKAELGKDYERVIALYPEFRELEEESFRKEQEWEDKCRTCINYDDSKYEYVENGEQWCRLYTINTKPYLQECPNYSKDQENN